jgi:hypothetical protein
MAELTSDEEKLGDLADRRRMTGSGIATLYE